MDSPEKSVGAGRHRLGWTSGGVVRLLARAARRLDADRGTHLAGSVAFRTLFSLFPLAILLAAVFAIVVSATGLRADVVDTIVRNVPLTNDGKAELRTQLEGATGGASALGLFALVGLVWAGTGMMAAIPSALNAAWDVADKRPFLRGKLIDLSLLVAAALLVLVSFVLSIGGRILSRHTSGPLDGMGGTVVSLTGGILVPLLLGFAAVLWLYRVVPARKTPLNELLPGAALVAVVFVALQNLFAVYVEHFTSYNAVYGSLGAIIGFLFFVYVASLAFLFGAQLSASLPEVRAELECGEPSGREAPLRERVLGAPRGLVREPPSSHS